MSCFQGRCHGAVIAYNRKGELHRVIHKTLKDKSPGCHTKKFTELRKKSAKEDTARKFPRVKRCLQYSEADEDYGPNAAESVPDMPLDELEVAKEEYVQKLTRECTEEKKIDIECRTRGQSSTHEWKEERRKRLTASNFGRICKMRASTSCSSLVQSIRYPTFVGTTGTKWGLEHEHVALAELSEHLHIPFRRSGLLIHPEHAFLGASPDALFDEDVIAEIKCPASIKDMSPQEAFKVKKLTCLQEKNGALKLKETHNYYYQVQGQLNISQRKLCYFVVWTPKGE